ncbi:hypothetical protein [Paraburkholderia phytofirmans]|uniref:Uncharacterized protein n=1 Tax=Paraburkholderia phytofirmans (strain DSM 17436 / LMG 22146 / PsJN) TaxID=398527 RepID=B2THB0_PARPJ|nr:hypothetical protein [Paraburkholderia phytofirmans]ACD21656.1 hypothetical protein Bphyt_7371 [Paraburkholderia phytofirmans PsJN]
MNPINTFLSLHSTQVETGLIIIAFVYLIVAGLAWRNGTIRASSMASWYGVLLVIAGLNRVLFVAHGMAGGLLWIVIGLALMGYVAVRYRPSTRGASL